MSRKTTSEPEFGAEKWLYSLRGKNRGKAQVSDFDHPPEGSPAPLDAAQPERMNDKVVTSGRQVMARPACNRKALHWVKSSVGSMCIGSAIEKKD